MVGAINVTDGNALELSTLTLEAFDELFTTHWLFSIQYH